MIRGWGILSNVHSIRMADALMCSMNAMVTVGTARRRGFREKRIDMVNVGLYKCYTLLMWYNR